MDARSFLALPTDVICQVLCEWLQLRDVCSGLDVALASRPLREAYLAHLRHFSCPITNATIFIDSSVAPLEWFQTRGAFFHSISFASNITPTIVAKVSPQMRENIRAVELSVQSLSPLDISCILSCSSLLSLTLSEDSSPRMTDEDVARICTHCPHLEYLSLSFVPYVTAAALSAMGTLANLNSLSVIGCAGFIVRDFVRQVISVLPHSLTELFMHGSAIVRSTAPRPRASLDACAERGCADSLLRLETYALFVLDALDVCSNLRSLRYIEHRSDFFDVHRQPQDIEDLLGSVQHLEELSIDNISSEWTPSETALWRQCSKLKRLEYGVARIDLRDWARSFECATNLVHVNIRTQLSSDVKTDSAYLADTLCRCCPQLQHLELMYGFFIDSSHLTRLRYLKELVLNTCVLSDDFMLQLAMCECPLKVLCLNLVESLEDDIITALLMRLDLLEELEIDDCVNLDESGLQVALQYGGNKLTRLFARGVVGSFHAALDILDSCPKLDTLQVDRMPISTHQELMRVVRQRYPGREITINSLV